MAQIKNGETVVRTVTYATPLKRGALAFVKGFVFAFVPAFTTFSALGPDKVTSAAIYSVVMAGLAGGMQAVYKYLKATYDEL